MAFLFSLFFVTLRPKYPKRKQNRRQIIIGVKPRVKRGVKYTRLNMNIFRSSKYAISIA